MPLMRAWHLVHLKGRRLSPVAEEYKAFLLAEGVLGAVSAGALAVFENRGELGCRARKGAAFLQHVEHARMHPKRTGALRPQQDLDLAARIQAGEFPPGSALPAQRELSGA